MATISFSHLSGFLSLTNGLTAATRIINMKHCRNISLVSCDISDCKDYRVIIGDKVTVYVADRDIYDTDSNVVSVNQKFITVKLRSGETITVPHASVHPTERVVWAIKVEYDSDNGIVGRHFLANEEDSARMIWNAIQTQMMEGSPGFVTAGEVPSAPTPTKM